jgi:hypothetical protein
MSKKQIVRLLKERYRTERVYQEMKTELGLDHFEGRSFPGRHHHISVALCCYAFRHRRADAAFPPRDRTAKCRSYERARGLSHFADSFTTIRLAIARAHALWAALPDQAGIR